MRLLHTSTWTLHDFPSQTPPYAILSHTHDEDEVTLAHLTSSPFPTSSSGTTTTSTSSPLEALSSLKGFPKLQGFLTRARAAGYSWAWASTACLDTTSTSELSEAANAMYAWYANAGVCLVHLADVPRFRLADSRWFERGWTLLELIAPRNVEFYTEGWVEIGSRASLAPLLSGATGIPLEVLRGGGGRGLEGYSAAEKMSWAAGRRTTRVEDEAYCLLGIFNVNMPILYGEGSKAFERLQREILAQTEDFTLLAWSPWAADTRQGGIFAPGTAAFKRPDLTSHLPSTAFDFDDAESILSTDMALAEWSDLRPQKWDAESALLPLSQFAFDPPQITARGISVTLPLDMGDSFADSGGRLDILAWLYVTVPSRAGSSRRSSGHSTASRLSNTDRSMMVCIWLTITLLPNDTFDTPLRAVRTPGRGPVCVPMVFMNRFHPRHVYLQNDTVPENNHRLTPVLSHRTTDLALVFKEGECARQLRIISHYPPEFMVSSPTGASQRVSGELSPARNGAMKSLASGVFEVCLPGGCMDISGALWLSFSGVSGGESGGERGDFVVVFRCEGAEMVCHLEPVDGSDLDESGHEEFWERLLWRGDRRIEGMDPTDRSSLVLSGGMRVKAAIGRHLARPFDVVIPTLTLTTYDADSSVVAMMERLLSND